MSAEDEARAQWAKEVTDPQATDELNHHLQSALRELAVDGEIDELACGQTLCRVAAHFASFDQAFKFETLAGASERRRAMDVTITDGVVDVEVYLAREEDSPAAQPSPP
jgi:hypothetical protein